MGKLKLSYLPLILWKMPNSASPQKMKFLKPMKLRETKLFSSSNLMKEEKILMENTKLLKSQPLSQPTHFQSLSSSTEKRPTRSSEETSSDTWFSSSPANLKTSKLNLN